MSTFICHQKSLTLAPETFRYIFSFLNNTTSERKLRINLRLTSNFADFYSPFFSLCCLFIYLPLTDDYTKDFTAKRLY
jgi:hypothetical protein